ncbi:unnamed protein product [Zymoseptoria tritici ST99CH_1A5]|uniref:Uncharacterized protein n=1 Tax=Zymoseptoria tritici ST99CH_1A5 TaxID=1276529 RepID=A0A1Y6LRQ6_ZYMTR|nr:unnamed protein product [Zymoseptoria tritici ST99CH_1A5]
MQRISAMATVRSLLDKHAPLMPRASCACTKVQHLRWPGGGTPNSILHMPPPIMPPVSSDLPCSLLDDPARKFPLRGVRLELESYFPEATAEPTPYLLKRELRHFLDIKHWFRDDLPETFDELLKEPPLDIITQCQISVFRQVRCRNDLGQHKGVIITENWEDDSPWLRVRRFTTLGPDANPEASGSELEDEEHHQYLGYTVHTISIEYAIDKGHIVQVSTMIFHYVELYDY